MFDHLKDEFLFSMLSSLVGNLTCHVSGEFLSRASCRIGHSLGAHRFHIMPNRFAFVSYSQLPTRMVYRIANSK
jgi:hypothetical protein